MTATLEVLGNLERKLTIELPVAAIEQEIDIRIKKLAKTLKMDGFRPGKAPLRAINSSHYKSVRLMVISEKVGDAFSSAAIDSDLRLAGQPTITERTSGREDILVFDSVFEVYPEVELGDLDGITVERIHVDVGEAQVNGALEALRYQHCTFKERAANEPVQAGDRATIDASGQVDGEIFSSGQLSNHTFIVSKGDLPKEFDIAALGMKIGEYKTFQFKIPITHQNKTIAGLVADFLLNVKKIESATLPDTENLLKLLPGNFKGTTDDLRQHILKNIKRETNFKVDEVNKSAVMNALTLRADPNVCLPQNILQLELALLIEKARSRMIELGIKDAATAIISNEVLMAQARMRVRQGLVLAAFVQKHALQATPAQIQAHIKTFAASYDNEEEVLRWYSSDEKHLSEVKAAVVEQNVVDFVWKQIPVIQRTVSFEELMNVVGFDF